MVALNVNHRVLLHQSRIVFKGHEIRRLSVDVKEQREGCIIFKVLHLAFRRAHGRSLGCARNSVEVGLSSALVYQNETDDGIVCGGGSHACVEPDIIALGNVVVARLPIGAGSRLTNALLTQPGVDPTVRIGAVPIVLLHKKIARVSAVYPLGNVLDRKILALTRASIAQNHTLDSRAAEQTDGPILHGINPVRIAIFIYLEGFLVEHICGVMQLHVAINVVEQRVGVRIANRFGRAYHFGILGVHVHNHVSGDAGGLIGPPLENIGIIQRTDAHGSPFVVDLGIQRGYLELGHVIGHGSHGAIAQKHGGITIDERNGTVINLLDVFGEVAVRRLQDRGVLLRIAGKERLRHQQSDKTQSRDKQGDDHQAPEQLFFARALFALTDTGGINLTECEKDHEGGKQDEQADELPQIFAMYIDGRMEPPVAKRRDDHNGYHYDDEGLAT